MNIPNNHANRMISGVILAVTLLATALAPGISVQASSSQALASAATVTTIYGDSLASGWQDWSWDATRNFSNPSPVQSGSYSISVAYSRAWAALYLHRSTPFSTTGYSTLEFYIHGGTSGGQKINIIANGNTSKIYSVTATANTWGKVSVPLSSLGSPASISDLYWQDAKGVVQPKYHLDNIRLIPTAIVATPTATRMAPTSTARPSATPANGALPTATVTKTAAPSATATTAPLPTGTPASSAGKFVTLPPGSALPSDEQCAAAVKPAPENKGVNKTANATRGNQNVSTDFANGAGTSIYNSRIDGNFTGTTDEILQWVACKWGIDEDIVRAQAAKESWWRMPTLGDWTTDSTRCAPGHGLGVDGTAGQCPESFGILQNRYPYEHDSWPGMANSTAFNSDVAYGYWRACYEGYTTWLGNGYAKGDLWGCVGRWFAGAWHTPGAETYISAVKDYYNQRIWQTAGFQEP